MVMPFHTRSYKACIAWGTSMSATIHHLASANPSLVLVAETADTNVWRSFNDSADGGTIRPPLQLKVETLSSAEFSKTSLLALISTKFDGVIEEAVQEKKNPFSKSCLA